MSRAALAPCPFCGATPEVDPGLSDAPGSGGFVHCATVWLPSQLGTGTTQGCPAWAEDAETWNALAAQARQIAALTTDREYDP